MQVALFSHSACLEHHTGPAHPERPDRLRAVLRALETREFAALLRQSAPRVSREQLIRVHRPDYVDAILAIALQPDELVALDPDTIVSAGSTEAALRAAGGAVAAVDAVQEGWAGSAFVAVRPPGHHAEPGRAMGFCLFNNVAVAAAHARERWGLRRVAVVDFDVHHGNGTQAMFAADPDLFYGSSHQQPCYPGTGHAHERGVAGNLVNAPLPPGAGGAAFRGAWAERILPSLADFAPELLIASAGFDAHRADPLADLRLEADDFAWLTRELTSLAASHCRGRIVSVLEGGYDLPALAACTAAHIRELLLR